MTSLHSQPRHIGFLNLPSVLDREVPPDMRDLKNVRPTHFTLATTAPYGSNSTWPSESTSCAVPPFPNGDRYNTSALAPAGFKSIVRACPLIFSATTTVDPPSSVEALRVNANTCSSSPTASYAPFRNAGSSFLNNNSRLYILKIESGSAFSVSTLYFTALGGIGSHGFVPVVKPACFPAFHCIGVRSPSRPFSFGQPSFPIGSCTSSLRAGSVVRIPISSP